MRSMHTHSLSSFLTEKNKGIPLFVFFVFVSFSVFSQNIKCDSIVKAIKLLAKSDSVYCHNADSAKNLAKNLASYITKINEDLKQTAKQNSKYQITTIYFFAPYNGTATIATDLKKQIEDYKKRMLSLTDSIKISEEQFGLNTKDIYSLSEDKPVTWEHNNFYNMPVSAASSVLNQLITEVYNSEEIILRALLKQLSLK